MIACDKCTHYWQADATNFSHTEDWIQIANRAFSNIIYLWFRGLKLPFFERKIGASFFSCYF